MRRSWRVAIPGFLVAGLVAAFAVVPMPAMHYHDSRPARVAAYSRPAVTCQIAGHFTFQQVGRPGYPLGLSQFKVSVNNCHDHIRAAMVCVYIGPRGAQFRALRWGGWVVAVNSTTRTTCQRSSIFNPPWQLGHAAAAGIQFYGSGGPGIHTHWFVGG